MKQNDGAAGALTWPDDAARAALARRLYDRVIEFCNSQAGSHHLPRLAQAIDEALDGEATATKIASYDRVPDAAALEAPPRLVALYADGLPGDRLLTLDFIGQLLTNYGFSVEHINDGVRPHLELIVNPTMEVWLHSLGVGQEPRTFPGTEARFVVSASGL